MSDLPAPTASTLVLQSVRRLVALADGTYAVLVLPAALFDEEAEGVGAKIALVQRVRAVAEAVKVRGEWGPWLHAGGGVATAPTFTDRARAQNQCQRSSPTLGPYPFTSCYAVFQLGIQDTSHSPDTWSTAGHASQVQHPTLREVHLLLTAPTDPFVVAPAVREELARMMGVGNVSSTVKWKRCESMQ